MEPAAAAPAKTQESRRQVTILFTDLAGFTALSTALDAEDLHAMVQAYFDRVERIVTGLGGSVERYIGDAVMAVFGARRAHEDDALRAVRAGLDVQAAMPELSARFGRPLAAVVGIAAGEVAVMEARPGYAADVAVVGASVNLAARIESLGEAGDVLVADEVYRQVRGRVQARSLGERTVKGIDRPVEVWKVQGLADPRAAAQTRLVGRQEQCGSLQTLLERCARGRGETVLLRGEAGIGKSRLLGALIEMARGLGYAVHGGTFLDFGLRRGTEGLAAVACSLLGVDVAAGALERRAAADAELARSGLDDSLRPFLYELIAAGQSEATRAVFDAMDSARRERGLRDAAEALLRSAAVRAPQVVAMEDVHWADAQDLERLAHLAGTCREVAVVFALTSRPTDDRVEVAWRTHGAQSALTGVELTPLGSSDMEALATQFGQLEPTVVLGCIARSGGNPLFLEQLLRHAAESGQTSIPGSIRSLVAARMDLLAPRDRSALQAAAVFGQRFTLEALRFLIEDAAYGADALLRANLLAADESELLFAHALIHEAAYATLLHRSTRALHLRAAEWYRPRDLALHARHLDRAESPAAPRAYLATAIADTEEGRHERARAEIARGLEIATDGGDRIALTLQLGQLLHDVGEVQESMKAYRVVLEGARADADRSRAWTGLAAGMRLADDFNGAFDALARAEEVAQGLDGELTRIHYLRGSLCFPRGDIEGCRREHAKALECARRAELPRAEANALSGLGDAGYASGRMSSAYESFRACMEICTRHGFGRIEAANRFMVATVRIYLNEFDGALADALESAELARKVGHQRAEIVSRLTAGWILLTLGRPEEARREADGGLRIALTLGAGRFRPFLMESLARVELATGGPAQARQTIEEALHLARDAQLMRFIGPWLLATFAVCADDPRKREAALEEGAELLAQGCVGHNYYHFYAHAIDASAAHRDGVNVSRWAEALDAYTRPEPNPWADFHIERGRAIAALVQTGEGTAAARVRAVRARAEQLGFRSSLATLDAVLAGWTPSAAIG